MGKTGSVCRQTPLHSWHQQAGACFRECDGWHIPAHYGNPAKERAAAADGIGLADISFFSKVELLGNHVALLAQRLAGSQALDPPRSVVRLLDPEPAVACRLTDDRLLILSESTTGKWPEHLIAAAAEHPVVAWDATSAHAGFHLEGPQLELLLRRLTALDLRPHSFPAAACAETAVAGVAGLLVRPPDPAIIRLHVGWDVAEYVWRRLLDAGRDLGLTVVGHDGLTSPMPDYERKAPPATNTPF